MLFGSKSNALPTSENALPGRSEPLELIEPHFLSGRSLTAPVPEGFDEIYVALGCFWGAERKFWQADGVWLTAVGYAGGHTPNPTYKEVCSGRTGHTEIVRVVFNPNEINLEEVLRIFWESHDPTQGMRQGNDVGTQYRSAIYTVRTDQIEIAERSRAAYQAALDEAGFARQITTEIKPLERFFFAEDYHQQYLAKVPNGYCGLGGTGISCPAPIGA